MAWHPFGNIRLPVGGKIRIGGDTQIEREAADRLYTADALAVGGTAGFRGAVALGAGGTVPSGQVLGVGGTLVVPVTIGTAVVPLDGAIAVTFGGGSARITTKVGGTAYVFLGIPQP